MIAAALDSVEAFRMRHIQRAQYRRIQDTKNYGVCANRQSQRQNGDDRESGRLAQNSKAEAQILYQNFDKIAAERFAAFFFDPLMAAELDARAAFRLCAIQTGTFQVIGAVLDV
jgi:hypothetical protein